MRTATEAQEDVTQYLRRMVSEEMLKPLWENLQTTDEMMLSPAARKTAELDLAASEKRKKGLYARPVWVVETYLEECRRLCGVLWTDLDDEGDTVCMLMDPFSDQKTAERHTVCTEIGFSAQSVARFTQKDQRKNVGSRGVRASKSGDRTSRLCTNYTSISCRSGTRIVN